MSQTAELIRATTTAERQHLWNFLERLGEVDGHFTKDDWQACYPSWALGGKGWGRVAPTLGGTAIQICLCWYQFRHKPGSKEWRPNIIIDAICRAAGLPLTPLPATHR